MQAVPQSAALHTHDAVRAAYVHVPFCHTLCGYCDFYSVVYEKGAVTPLVDALLAELESVAATVSGADTIFVGGGTPTTLPTADLTRLLDALRERLRLASDGEFTCEANPATVSPEVAVVLARCGVNRVSIGAQSFDPGELRVLERIHQPAQVAETIRNVRAAGIDNVNVDLIFAVPGQSLASWLDNLRRAIDLGVEHLSCYALTYEPGTPLYEQRAQGRICPADPDLEAEMYEATIDVLAQAGLDQYEISNFARSGRRCRHNLAYWRNQPYLGIGPSAAGYVGGVRYRNVPDHRAYVQAAIAGRSPRIEHERRDRHEAARDAMMMGLRLNEGIDRRRFAACYGSDPLDLFAEAVGRHVAAGLLEQDPYHVRLTARGRMLADSVLEDFV